MPGRGVLSAVMDEALELVAPTRCVGCDEPGALLCDECLAALPWVRQELACPNCGAPHGGLTCTECSEPWETRACVCALGFLGPVRRLVPAMKDYHELRLAPVMAAAMLCALEEASVWPAADGRPRYDAGEVDAVCFVPATAAAFARRGFDHMELVARELCRLTGLPLADVLVRRRARDQRELGQAERAANLAGTVEVADDVSGMRLLLLDDVVTTGSTIREASRPQWRGPASGPTTGVGRVYWGGSAWVCGCGAAPVRP